MALYQTCVRNRITDLGKARTRERLVRQEVSADFDFIQIIEQSTVKSFNNGPLLVALNEAPNEIKQFFMAMLDDNKRNQLCQPYDKHREGRRKMRETTNEHLCRVLGFDPRSIDISTMLRKFLTDLTT